MRAGEEGQSAPADGALSRAPARRVLEGWQLGLLAVLMPLLALWLALPRPVTPGVLPLPEVNRREHARAVSADLERSQGVRLTPLPFAVRAVGEQVRRYGRASVERRASVKEQARVELRRQFRKALAEHGAEPLLALRALQTQMFLDATRRLNERHQPDTDFAELAGDLLEKARQSNWLAHGGQWVFSRTELFALYRIRWTELAGALKEPAFRPSLQDVRIYYRALLEHPEGDNPLEREWRRLSYLGPLSRRDTQYPVELARGILLYRLGQQNAASLALMDYLAARPNGPYALHARNYLLAALADQGRPE